MFTKLYISEYKLNNMQDINLILEVMLKIKLGVIISWSGRVTAFLVIGGSGRVGSGRFGSEIWGSDRVTEKTTRENLC